MTITLANADISVSVDPDRGAEIDSVVAVATGLELLGRTPWAAAAQAARRSPTRAWQPSSEVAWLQGYRGGWQTLFPNAGPATVQAGVEQGFHGEASTTPWRTVSSHSGGMQLEVELFTAPLRAVRTVTVIDAAVTVVDRLLNLSSLPVDYDYVQHPAFGAPFLEPGCRINSGARTIVIPTGFDVAAGRHPWPYVPRPDGRRIDLSVVPDEPRSLFGWLTDFEQRRLELVNSRLGIGARIEWEGPGMDYAWYWQELFGSPDHPWFRRAYLMALEPSSTAGGAPDARRRTIDGHSEQTFSTTLSIRSLAQDSERLSR